MRNFIVASASPRRHEILHNGGYTFTVIPSDADETVSESLTSEQTVIELAKRKALAVLEDNEDCVVFGCDTVVAVDGKILGKPKDDEDALSMLKMLSGRIHTVSTGVCVADKDRCECAVNTTLVEFYELSDSTIKSYIATKECEDKAGAYGIQGFGSVLIKRIEGDYFSVMGLPISRTARILNSFGIKGKVTVD